MKKSKASNPKVTTPGPDHPAAKALEALKKAEAARKRAQLAKARFKAARRAFKIAKKAAKRAVKAAKAAVEAKPAKKAKVLKTAEGRGTVGARARGDAGKGMKPK